MLTERERDFVGRRAVARLATADRAGQPHVVPVCFGLVASTVYVAIDQKPKRVAPKGLKRLRNIGENPAVAILVDRYDADWRRLGFVLLRGRAEILQEGAEHAEAQKLLRARYPQLAEMDIEGLPVIAIRIARVTSWGDLSD